MLRSYYHKGTLITALSDEEVRRHFIPKDAQVQRIRRMLLKNGKMIDPDKGPVVIAAVRHVNWEQGGLVDHWKKLATVIHYDRGKEGFDQNSNAWHWEGKGRFNERLLEEVKNNHERQGIDIFFSYL